MTLSLSLFRIFPITVFTVLVISRKVALYGFTYFLHQVGGGFILFSLLIRHEKLLPDFYVKIEHKNVTVRGSFRARHG